MDQKVVKLDLDLYSRVTKLAKDKDVSIPEALRMLLAEKNPKAPESPGEVKKEEIFDFGKLLKKEFIAKAFIGGFFCKPCYQKNLKEMSWFANKEVELRRDEVEAHFKELHPELLEKSGIVPKGEVPAKKEAPAKKAT